MNKIIDEKLKLLPSKSGVYLMKDNLGNIIYVGKAKILKNRVRQYFMKSKNHSNKVLKMVENIDDFNWIVTDSEVEALILECNLIKKYSPKYNILLKDDKTYPYIKITVNEDYPRILLSRKTDDKTAKYFGPYTSSYSVKQTIDLLRKIFEIRSCNKDLSKKIKRECLNYHIKQCSAPCVGYISQYEYREKINNVIEFLEGKSKKIISELTQKMYEHSDKLEFEKAGEVKNKLEHIDHILEKQKISVPSDASYDVIGMYEGEKYYSVNIMFIRNGKLLGSKNLYFDLNESKESTLNQVLKQFYHSMDLTPKEILLPFYTEEHELLEEFLLKVRGSKVELTVPKIGRKKELIDLAWKNAQEGLKQKISNKYANALEEMKSLLHLERTPERIEVYDISNTSGADIVGFMTVFIDGKPAKSEYRKFKIKYTEGQDDYECMYEVILRRLLRHLEEKEKLENDEIDEEKLKFYDLPDVIFVDGGMNHVKSGMRACEAADIHSISVFGLVKDNKHRTRDITSDFREYGAYKYRALFNLVSSMQDETHNEAVNYHHSVRTKTTVQSDLLNIPGVGPATRNKLLKVFKTYEDIKNADIKQLSMYVNEKIAENIYNYYHRNK